MMKRGTSTRIRSELSDGWPESASALQGSHGVDQIVAGSRRALASNSSTSLAKSASDRVRQRKSDGTVVIEGRRFEIPNRYRHLSRIEVRYAGWDLGLVHLVDEHTGKALSRLYPQDKTENASGL